MSYPPEFTIAYLVHGELPLLERTIPATLRALCGATTRSYDLVLVIDRAETAQLAPLMDLAVTWGFDEVRMRWRSRHRASGDQTNNIHTHLVSDKSRFLITIEGDVVAFRTRGDVDVLDEIARTFDACPALAVAQRIDDHDCWQWPLTDVAGPLAPGIRSVNRVASHFLVYETTRARPAMARVGGIPGDAFFDDGERWFNYEDWISATFAQPAGPGIGFLEDLPLRVYHCDRKCAPGSAHYLRDLATRMDVFDERARAFMAPDIPGHGATRHVAIGR